MSRSWMLLPEATSPGTARSLIQSVCSSWSVDGDLCDDAQLVASELVSNVVDHARTRCVLSARVDGDELCVEVRDFRPCPPLRPRPPDPRSRRGRGLQMVSLIAKRWGVTEFDDGKSVWAVLTVAD